MIYRLLRPNELFLPGFLLPCPPFGFLFPFPLLFFFPPFLESAFVCSSCVRLQKKNNVQIYKNLNERRLKNSLTLLLLPVFAPLELSRYQFSDVCLKFL